VEEALAFIVTFREAFEAFLLAGVIAGVLAKTGRRRLLPGVAAGLAAAALLGVAGGVAVYRLRSGLPWEGLFEAAASIAAAIVVLSIVYWMGRRGSRVAGEARGAAAEARGLAGVALLTLALTGRESVETVLILAPALAADPAAAARGAAAGASLAALLAAAVALAGARLDLRLFFRVTSALLVLVAASLAGYGVHEAVEWLEGRGVHVGLLGEEAFRVDLPEGHPLNPDEPLGAALSVVAGWDPEPEVARLAAQALTLAVGAALLAARRPGGV